MKQLRSFIIGLISIIFFDRIRLGNIANTTINQEIGTLMLDSIHIGYGIVAWALLVAGILLFVHKHTHVNTTKNAILYGAFFGLITYGVYDFTNIAILQGRTVKMLILDIIWGGVVCGLVSGIMWKVSK